MRNKEYWSARERANQLHIKEMIAKGADYDKAISAFYNASLTEINKEIASFYVKYATSEGLSLAEAKRKVSKMDVKAYEAQAAQYVKEKNFTAQANAELRLYNATMRINRLELLKAKIGMYAAGAGSDLENYMTETLTDEAKAELRRQAGILGETIDHVNPEDVKHIVTGSYRADMAKYTMGKTTFSERIWGNNESLKGNLDRLLTQALINGKGPNALASDLRKQYDVSKYEASRLMRTESARVQGAAAIQNMLDHGIREYEWISEPDSKTCHECAALNGKRFKIEAGKVGENLIPLHPNCRCAIMPVDDEIASNDANSGIIIKKGLPLDLQLFAEKDITRQESNSLKRGIRSYKKRILEHEKYISNPAAHADDWDKLGQKERDGLIKHWKKEIRNFKQAIQDRVDELKERGDYDE